MEKVTSCINMAIQIKTLTSLIENQGSRDLWEDRGKKEKKKLKRVYSIIISEELWVEGGKMELK